MRGYLYAALVVGVMACSSFDATEDPASPGGGTNPDGGSVITGTPADYGVSVVGISDVVPVVQGGSTKLTITIQRGPEQAGPVRLNFRNGRDGIGAQEVTILNNVGEIEIAAPASAAQGAATGTIEATGKTDTGTDISGTTPLKLLVRGQPGALDTTFGTTGDGYVKGLFPGTTAGIIDIALAADDSIYVLSPGDPAVSGSRPALVAHVSASGKLDTSYGNGGVASIGVTEASRAIVAPDGGLLVAGGNTLASVPGKLGRLTTAGQPDTNFGSGGLVAMSNGTLGGSPGAAIDIAARASDGAIFVAFNNMVGNDIDNGVLALTSSGAVRPSFGSSGAGQTSDARGGSSVLVRNNSMSLSKGFVALIWNAQSPGQKHGFYQVNGDTGAGDPRESGIQRTVPLSQPLQGFANTRVELSDDSIVATVLNFNVSLRLYKHTALGDPAPGFGTNGFSDNIGSGETIPLGLALQNDGGLVVALSAPSAGSLFQMTRVTSTGRLDTAFGVSGIVSLMDADLKEAFGVVVQKTTGRIVAGANRTGGGSLAALWP